MNFAQKLRGITKAALAKRDYEKNELLLVADILEKCEESAKVGNSRYFVWLDTHEKVKAVRYENVAFKLREHGFRVVWDNIGRCEVTW